MRDLVLSIAGRLSDRNRWMVGYALKWLLLILVLILYTLIVARASYAKAERLYESGQLDWQIEYAEGYAAHMKAVETNMPQAVDPEQQTRIEMMNEFWRKHK